MVCGMLAPTSSEASPRRGLLIASYLAVCIVWGSTYLAIAVALEGFPPFILGAVRFIASGVIMLGFARLRGEPWPDRRQWAGAAFAGAFLFVIGNGLVNAAELSVSSGVSAVLIATVPLWMTVLGRVLGEPITRREVAGVVLGLLGVGIMNLGGELRASPYGVLMLLCAPLGWAIGSYAAKRLPSPPGTMRIGVQMLSGGVSMAVVAAALGERMHAAPSGRALLATVYLLVFGSLIGFSAYSYLLKHTRPAVATSYAYINPVIAVLLGVTLAGEPFESTSALGGAVILAAVILVGLARAKKVHGTTAASTSSASTTTAGTTTASTTTASTTTAGTTTASATAASATAASATDAASAPTAISAKLTSQPSLPLSSPPTILTPPSITPCSAPSTAPG
jgi:drug/metabolite transporter (DMT)-like permease